MDMPGPCAEGCFRHDEASVKRRTSRTQGHFMPASPAYIGRMERFVDIIEHPGELRLRLRAASFGELAAAAAGALAELELRRAPAVASDGWREIRIGGRDREAVLVHWLNELIYLAETERWVATEFEPVRATDTELTMRARGVAVEIAPSQVKAATFHGLRIAPVAGGMEAELVLDV